MINYGQGRPSTGPAKLASGRVRCESTRPVQPRAGCQ